ncbi:MAG: ABC transporter permease [Chloroflexi bacterium]|nr:ABC transporter permease [Chloroflexota bacterium]
MELIWQALVEGGRLIVSADPELRRIVLLSLTVSGTATLLAAAIGVPLGAALCLGRFPGRGLAMTVVNTGFGLPPVLVGLALTILLWRSGPLGPLRLLFTPAAMVAAQLIVATPIVAGLTRSALELLGPELLDALRSDGASESQAAWELVQAARRPVLVAIAAGFGRAIAEVGASLMVGGNIVGQTRILTTTIALEAGRGEFALAMAMGLVLLGLAFLVNAALTLGLRSST